MLVSTNTIQGDPICNRSGVTLALNGVSVPGSDYFSRSTHCSSCFLAYLANAGIKRRLCIVCTLIRAGLPATLRADYRQGLGWVDYGLEASQFSMNPNMMVIVEHCNRSMLQFLLFS